jgi:hypothetical protein
MGLADTLFENVVSPIYFWLLVLIYAAYISAALGLWYVYPGSLHILTNSMQVFVATVLVLRFNPFRQNKTLRPLDERLIFASGVMLLVNAGLAGFLKNEAATLLKLN